MPVDRSNYPPNWQTFSLKIRRGRARDRCECRGECGVEHGGRCTAINGQRKFYTAGGRVFFVTVWLATGHLWKDEQAEGWRQNRLK